MSRPPRIEIADGIYHVFARGNERRSVFRDDDDRVQFLELLAAITERRAWNVLAYCLMGNHYHLLAQTPNADLSARMHNLNAVYAQRFNRRYDRVGHLFQGRFGARLVQYNEHVLSTVRYIVRNPVRVGICATPAEWPWSSHLATIGGKRSRLLRSDLVLALVSDDPERAPALYRELTEGNPPGELDDHPLVAGEPEFVREHLARLQPCREYPLQLTVLPRALSEFLGEEPTTAQLVAARDEGHTLTAIAAYLGVNKSTVSRRVRSATIET